MTILRKHRPILAGPWLGEFGWEIMRWQGIFRALAERGRSITMVARSGHEALYSDYVSAFIPAAELGLPEFGATDGWRLDGREPRIPRRLRWTRFWNYEEMRPRTCMRRGVDVCGAEQSFVRYRGKPPAHLHRYVVVHGRSTDKAGSSDRNWPLAWWTMLVPMVQEMGVEVVAIGHPQQSVCPPGAIDRRGMPLSETIGLVGHALVVVGPSSGPMHLASVCGTPHLVWTDRAHWGSSNGTNRERYERSWNPLGTPVHVIDAYDWQPPVDVVVDAVRKVLVSGGQSVNP